MVSLPSTKQPANVNGKEWRKIGVGVRHSAAWKSSADAPHVARAETGRPNESETGTSLTDQHRSTTRLCASHDVQSLPYKNKIYDYLP